LSRSTILAAAPASRSVSRRETRGGPGPRLRRSPLSIVFLTVFLDLVGFGIVIPLLPLYAETFGAGPVAVTWLVAVYSLMQFLFAPWWGALSDRVGRRPVLLVGLFGSAASYLLFGLAASLPLLFFARALAGFMGANVGVAQAYIADVTAPEDRARGMGLIGAAFGLGFVFGPAIGGLLSHFGPAVPFLGAAGLALANGIFALARLPESLPPGGRTSTGGGLRARVRALADAAREPRLRGLYAAAFLSTLALAAMEGTFSLWADRRWALSPAEVAFLFAYVGVLAVVVQGALVGRLARGLGERRLARVGAVALAAGLAGIPLAPTLPVLALALAAFAFGQGTVTPSLSSLISRGASPREQGRLLGVSQSLSALGRVLGPVWGGVAFARLGVGAPYLSGAAVVLLALTVLAASRAGGER
jgi:DHA1 family tetracycline resistance protein-like MFS transporter